MIYDIAVKGSNGPVVDLGREKGRSYSGDTRQSAVQLTDDPSDKGHCGELHQSKSNGGSGRTSSIFMMSNGDNVELTGREVRDRVLETAGSQPLARGSMSLSPKKPLQPRQIKAQMFSSLVGTRDPSE